MSETGFRSETRVRRHDPEFEAWIAQAKNVSAMDAARRLGFSGRGRGSERCGACIVCGSAGSSNARASDRFSVVVSGAKSGAFNCRKCGLAGFGGIDLMMQARGLAFLPACEELAGPPPSGAVWTEADKAAWREEQAREQAERAKEAEKQAALAAQFREDERKRLWKLWTSAVPASVNADVAAYLAARAIEGVDAYFLRALPDYEYFHGQGADGKPCVIHRGPVMLACFQRADGRFGGLHITYVDPARPGRKMALTDPETGEALNAKKMRGTKKGCAIPLAGAPPQAMRRLFIGEGVETVGSVRTALMRSHALLRHDAFWAAGDLGNLGGPHAQTIAHPSAKTASGRAQTVPGPQPDMAGPAIMIPPGVSEIVLLGDGDSEPFLTQQAMLRAAARWRKPGRLTRIVMAPEGLDFNNVLMGAA